MTVLEIRQLVSSDLGCGDTPVIDVDEQLETLVRIGQVDEHAAVRALNATIREAGDEHVLLGMKLGLKPHLTVLATPLEMAFDAMGADRLERLVRPGPDFASFVLDREGIRIEIVLGTSRDKPEFRHQLAEIE